MAVCSLSASAQRVVAELDPIATPLLGLVDGEVGIAQHLVGGEVGVLADRHADRDVDVQCHLADLDRFAHRLAESLGEVERGVDVGDGFGDDEELVAAETADVVTAADGRLESSGHGAEHGVTGGMAVLVVDVLEPVEVEEQHGDRLTGSPRTSETLVELFE